MKHSLALALAGLVTGLAANSSIAEQGAIPPQTPDQENRFPDTTPRKDPGNPAGSKRDYQSTPNSGLTDSRLGQTDSEKEMWERLGTTQKANEIIGSRVRTKGADLKSESYGKVEDLAIDLESGRVLEVIVATGGWFSGGTRHLSFPPSSLLRSPSATGFDLNYDTEKLKGAPAFDVNKWDESVAPERVVENYQYYDILPYWTANPERSHRLDNAARNEADRNGTNRTLRSESDRVDRTQKDRPYAKDNTSREGEYDNKNPLLQASAESHRMGRLDRVSRIIGMSVQNNQDEKLGKIDNMLIDLHAGRIVHVVVSTGGFLGIADELSLVPPSAFKFSSDRDSLRLDTTKDRLSRSPHFNGQSWPDVNDPAYVGGVYNSYNVRPYFETNALPDNTARNVRERGNKSLTPLDQGNNESDIAVSRRIRKEILATENLSVNARNVKIITTNGHVTLKGPVASEYELKTIAEIAFNAAQSGNVDNQLEIQNRR